MSTSIHPDLLVLSTSPFSVATRGRKAALMAATKFSNPIYLGCSRMGRSGQEDTRLEFEIGVLRVFNMRSYAPLVRPTFYTKPFNLIFIYLPLFVKLQFKLLQLRPKRIFVVGLPLSILCFMPKILFGSHIYVDLNELMNCNTEKDSLYGLVSVMDVPVARLWARYAMGITTVSAGNVSYLRKLLSVEVILLRNLPLRGEIPDFSPPTIRKDGKPLRFIYVGRIAEGLLLHDWLLTASELMADNIDFCFEFFGHGPVRFIEDFQNEIDGRGLCSRVFLHRAIPRSEVIKTLKSGDLGLVSYDPTLGGNDGLPNKLFDVISAGRVAVIAAGGDEIPRFVLNNNIGAVLMPRERGCWASILKDLSCNEDFIERWAAINYNRAVTTLCWENDFQCVLDSM